jgi:N-acetyl-anhydromuramyl-L-alanine amidase AmpD
MKDPKNLGKVERPEDAISKAHEFMENQLTINEVEFPVEQYYHEKHEKTQIVLHHTVSGKGQSGDINWWKSTPDHIATAFIVSRTGEIVQLFDEAKWAHHLGIKSADFRSFDLQPNNAGLNKGSIAIEIDSWGGLKSATDKKVDAVIEYPEKYRGFKYFEKYYDDQLEAVRKLLLHLCKKYSIPLTYHENMFEQNRGALGGMPGIWLHTSYRKDKSDCHPQPELIEMLQKLTP